MRCELFEPEDLLMLKPQAPQLADIPRDKRLEHGFQFRDGGSAFTIWDDVDGQVQPVFCGGALRRHREYAQLWGLFSVHKPRVPLRLTKIVRRFVADQREARIEAQVASSNAGALGWARLIGLEEETRLRGAMPDLSDMVIFVRPFDAGRMA